MLDQNLVKDSQLQGYSLLLRRVLIAISSVEDAEIVHELDVALSKVKAE